MKKYLAILVLYYLLLFNCSPWKSGLIEFGENSELIKNAILDFANTSSLFNLDNSFSVEVKALTKEVIGVSLIGNVNKFIVTSNGKTSRIPTSYLEYEGKLFYWYDENSFLNNNTIQKFDEFNLIDSIEHFGLAEFRFNDEKEGVDYYFCRNSFLNYKKVKTNKPLGDYNYPIPKCN